jgi:hypothetical protein
MLEEDFHIQFRNFIITMQADSLLWIIFLLAYYY